MHYWRLHGSPRTYYSDYDDTFLQRFAQQLRHDRQSAPDREQWVIFDNTALGCAAANALRLQELMRG